MAIVKFLIAITLLACTATACSNAKQISGREFNENASALPATMNCVKVIGATRSGAYLQYWQDHPFGDRIIILWTPL